jgi:hypothetical protein
MSCVPGVETLEPVEKEQQRALCRRPLFERTPQEARKADQAARRRRLGRAAVRHRELRAQAAARCAHERARGRIVQRGGHGAGGADGAGRDLARRGRSAEAAGVAPTKRTTTHAPSSASARAHAAAARAPSSVLLPLPAAPRSAHGPASAAPGARYRSTAAAARANASVASASSAHAPASARCVRASAARGAGSAPRRAAPAARPSASARARASHSPRMASKYPPRSLSRSAPASPSPGAWAARGGVSTGRRETAVSARGREGDWGPRTRGPASLRERARARPARARQPPRPALPAGPDQPSRACCSPLQTRACGAAPARGAAQPSCADTAMRGGVGRELPGDVLGRTRPRGGGRDLITTACARCSGAAATSASFTAASVSLRKNLRRRRPLGCQRGGDEAARSQREASRKLETLRCRPAERRHGREPLRKVCVVHVMQRRVRGLVRE